MNEPKREGVKVMEVDAVEVMKKITPTPHVVPDWDTFDNGYWDHNDYDLFPEDLPREDDEEFIDFSIVDDDSIFNEYCNELDQMEFDHEFEQEMLEFSKDSSEDVVVEWDVRKDQKERMHAIYDRDYSTWEFGGRGNPHRSWKSRRRNQARRFKGRRFDHDELMLTDLAQIERKCEREEAYLERCQRDSDECLDRYEQVRYETFDCDDVDGLADYYGGWEQDEEVRRSYEQHVAELHCRVTTYVDELEEHGENADDDESYDAAFDDFTDYEEDMHYRWKWRE